MVLKYFMHRADFRLQFSYNIAFQKRPLEALVVTMKTNGEIPSLLRQLENLNTDLYERPRQIKQIQKDLQFLYDDLCAAFWTATPEQRVDVHVALEFRTPLALQLVIYYKQITAQAQKSAAKKRQAQNTKQLIRQAMAARALLEHKVPEAQLENIHAQIARSAASLQLDLDQLHEELDILPKYFIQRAMQYQKAGDRIRALKALGIALQENPSLEKNDRVVTMAAELTSESEVSAIITLSDGYVLRKFVEELEFVERRDRIIAEESKPRSTLETIRSWFAS